MEFNIDAKKLPVKIKIMIKNEVQEHVIVQTRSGKIRMEKVVRC